MLVGVMLFADTQCSFACSCIQPPAPRDALASSDAVFAGRVVGIFDGNLNPIRSSADPIRATFQINTVWKGAASPTLVVTSARNGASCGFHFEQGREYLIYAYAQNGELHTDICTRSAELNNAQADLAALGAGQTIANVAPESPSLMPWVIGIVIVVLLVALVLFGSGLFMIQKKDS